MTNTLTSFSVTSAIREQPPPPAPVLYRTKMKMESNHMTPGSGEDSYTRNSLVQAVSISKVFPVVRDAMEGLYSRMLPKCVVIAELGCASGPNTLMLLPQVIDTTYNIYRNMNCGCVPEIQLFLNDLPANDFNTISLSLDTFSEELDEERKGDIEPYFISATPGSYYKRIFPKNFLHFVHCSNSVHWLSKVPKNLFDESGESVNKGNIYIADTSDPEVVAAYREQFEEDFSAFLKARGEEIVSGGRMVINIMESTNSHKPQDFFMTRLLNLALKDMVSKGMIDKKKLDDFEIAFYPPKREELEKVIDGEGSFYVEQHEHFTLDWDEVARDELGIDEKSSDTELYKRAKYISGPVRSGCTYLIATQFGSDIISDLYSRLIDLIAQGLKTEKMETSHQVVHLVRK